MKNVAHFEYLPKIILYWRKCMKKNINIVLLFLLSLFGVGAMISPIGKALESTSTSRIWSYSLYTRYFGGGYSGSKIGNCGPLTLAWILNLVALVVCVVLIILYFVKYELSRKTSVILYSIISVFYVTAGVLVLATPALVGNTDSATLGIGSILTSCFMLAAFIVGLIIIIKSLFQKDEE